MNHESVINNKGAVMRFGGYQDDLANVRGEDMSTRRGGWKYFRSEKKFQKCIFQHSIINFLKYVYNVAICFGSEVVTLNFLRSKLFKLTRDSIETEKINPLIDNKDVFQKKKEEYPPFSVAMSVYGNDNAKWFDIALESIINQSVKPNEIVIVVDGPIPQDIHNIINKYTEICSKEVITFNIIYLKKNKGLGNALRVAIDNCSNNIVARMDSDDVSLRNRFEEQLKILIQQPSIDIIGGDIAEFINDEENIVSKRVVPITDNAIKNYMKTRCPFNHVSVMYKKSAIISAGGYKDLFWNEDYWLWIRMAENGCIMANTGTVLVKVRVGTDMYKRRGGRKYFASELYLQKYMLKRKIISPLVFIGNIGKRFLVQVLMPNQIRGIIFRKFARIK